jgi:hypothetical protein
MRPLHRARLATAVAASVVLVLGLAAPAGAQDSPAPPVAAPEWSVSACAALDEVTAAFAEYRDGIDPTQLSTDERKARAERLSAPLRGALTATQDALGDVRSDPFADALGEWASRSLAAQEALARAVAGATSSDELTEASAAVSSAQAAADETFLAGLRSFPADRREATAVIEACLPPRVRGEPLPGWTSPLRWEEVFFDSFGEGSAWPLSDDAAATDRITGGQYRMTLKDGPRVQFVTSTGSSALEPVASVGDVRVTVVAAVPEEGAVGALCRVEPSLDGGYAFIVSPTGYQLARYGLEDNEVLASRATGSAGPAAPREGVSVGAECTGSGGSGDPVRLTMTIEDDLVLQLIDTHDALASGSVGFLGETSRATDEATIPFDEISISRPASDAPAP